MQTVPHLRLCILESIAEYTVRVRLAEQVDLLQVRGPPQVNPNDARVFPHAAAQAKRKYLEATRARMRACEKQTQREKTSHLRLLQLAKAQEPL